MTFEEALNFRHACKIFDENKKISEEDFNKILNAGRLSPSSMGMQPWEFEVITNRDLLDKVKASCWNQIQITTASKVLVLYAKIEDLKAGSAYTKYVVSTRKDKNQKEQEAYLERYNMMIKTNVGESDLDIFNWSRANCYLAAQNLMMQAAILGIDSCPMEGFVKDDLQKTLGIDPKLKQVALVIAFGYRLNDAPQKNRLDSGKIVKFR